MLPINDLFNVGQDTKDVSKVKSNNFATESDSDDE